MGLKGSKLGRIVRLRREPDSLTTPRGYIPVAVGVHEEKTRLFMVHTKALHTSELMELLRRSAEEYQFCNQGVLRIPCDDEAFEQWLITTAKRKIFRVQPMHEYVWP